MQKQKTPWKKSVTSTASIPPANTMKTAKERSPTIIAGNVGTEAPRNANWSGSPSIAMKNLAVTPGKMA